jgi:D-sedoheptulose 7-phosphate isomerase
MTTDFNKNGQIRALCFNDGSALTCLANDLGYEEVFAHPIRMHGRDGDLLIAISSSGNSQNILNGVMAARECGAHVITFSGFRPDNKLRRLGDYNVYVPSEEYGFVEVTHQALCHAFIDFVMGWGADKDAGNNPVRLSA